MWLSYWLAIRKNRLAKKRDLRTQYLLDAYRGLESASNRIMSHDVERALELRIADIQLLGSESQVGLAKEFAQKFARDKSATLDELHESLRRDLRKELDLGSVRDQLVHLRIERGPTDPKTHQDPR